MTQPSSLHALLFASTLALTVVTASAASTAAAQPTLDGMQPIWGESALGLGDPAAPAALADEAEPSRAARRGGALLGGGLSAGAMVGLTSLVVWGQLRDCPDDWGSSLDCAFGATGAIVSLSGFAYAPAIAGGVTLGGHAAGGQGRYDVTLLGSSLGTGVGYALLAAVASASPSDRAFGVSMALVPLMQVAGAMLFYEISAGRAERARERDAGPHLAPTFTADANGAVVGLSGSF